MGSLKAKDDIDNVGAGRAAKGATLVTCFLCTTFSETYNKSFNTA